MNMKTILVPTDFSKTAHNASVYAMNLARELKARVILLHVYHPSFTIPGAENIPTDLAGLQQEAEDKLSHEAGSLKGMDAADISCIAKPGFAVDVILDMERASTLTVMGMQGAGQHSGFFPGSITTSILPLAKRAVLVIPEEARYRDPENVVFACDPDFADNAASLNSLKCFTSNFGSRITALHVRSDEAPGHVEKKLQAIANDSGTNLFIVEAVNTVEGLNDFIEEQNADLLAIVPRQHKLIERLFHKSISKSMAIHTHVPMLALPLKQKAIEAGTSCAF
jgi:nucleotide-binding universal stress UspA family protein